MEILLHVPWWIWLLVSLIPYSIKRQQTPHMQSLVLAALFWQFTLKYQKRQCLWSFSLPCIEQIQRNLSLRKLLISMWARLIQEWGKKVISLWR